MPCRAPAPPGRRRRRRRPAGPRAATSAQTPRPAPVRGGSSTTTSAAVGISTDARGLRGRLPRCLALPRRDGRDPEGVVDPGGEHRDVGGIGEVGPGVPAAPEVGLDGDHLAVGPTASARALANSPTPAYRSRRAPRCASTAAMTAATKVAAAPGCTCQNPRPTPRSPGPVPRRRRPATWPSTRSWTVGTPGCRAPEPTASGRRRRRDGIHRLDAPARAARSPAGGRCRGGDAAVVDRHDVVGAVPPQPGPALRVDGELDPGAPVEAVLSPGTGSTSTSTSRCASRAICSRTTSALSGACRGRATCWRSQPPQRPGRAHGHGGAPGRDADDTATASARTKRSPAPVSVTRASTRSPGRACRTNSTWPSWRATQ